MIGGRLANWLTPTLGDLQEHANPVLSKTTITIGTLALAAIGVLVAFPGWSAAGPCRSSGPNRCPGRFGRPARICTATR